MANYKLVESKGDFELVSYMFKDLTHYAIRLKGTDNTFETAAPTKELKGWDLRKAMTEKLATYASGEASETKTFKGTSSVTTNTKDLQVGMVITYQNPSWLGNQKFSRIIKLAEWLIFCVGPNGENIFWQYDSLEEKLREGTFKVLHPDQVPEGITFPAEPLSV